MKRTDPFKSAREFAAVAKARVTVPSDPDRPRNMNAKTDVAATWAPYLEAQKKAREKAIAKAKRKTGSVQQLRRAK